MKREIHRSTDVPSYLIEQALVLATATAWVSESGYRSQPATHKQKKKKKKNQDKQTPFPRSDESLMLSVNR